MQDWTSSVFAKLSDARSFTYGIKNRLISHRCSAVLVVTTRLIEDQVSPRLPNIRANLFIEFNKPREGL